VSAVTIRLFTDPGCPFAFSAERQRHRLLWLYGDQITWELHMIAIGSEKQSDWWFGEIWRDLYVRYGMPIDWSKRLWLAPTIHACRAVVAVGLRWPDRQAAFLRRLRVLAISRAMQLDDSDTLEIAAEHAGLPVAELAAYCAEPEVETTLQADMKAARTLSPGMRAQDYKLGGPPEERRYTCPTYEIVAGRAQFAIPGFRPLDAYEVALANLAPELTRRDDPSSVEEVLAWAHHPLATAEVAMVCDREIADVRPKLARVARFEPAGADGYWSLA
jgi:predicted DsbA family dithiol-disulfide isomerase